MTINRSTPFHWSEWDGSEYPQTLDTVYYVNANIDLTRAKARENLAKDLKTDGLVDSVYDAHVLLEQAVVVHGHVSYLDGDEYPTYYSGDTDYNYITPATWVEFNYGD